MESFVLTIIRMGNLSRSSKKIETTVALANVYFYQNLLPNEIGTQITCKPKYESYKQKHTPIQ